MVPFDSKRGFKPEGKVLKFWTLLPQVSTSLGHIEIPSLFGGLKNIGLYYIFVGFLIALELLSIFLLENEGVPPMVLIIISALDFIIALIPALWETKDEFNPRLIKANIFIAETRLKIQSKIPENFENNTENYRVDNANNLKKLKSQKIRTFWIKILFAILILTFGLIKFLSYWGIFGVDIFIEPSGRLVLGTILLSIYVHIFCTKTVLYHIIFKSTFKKQEKNFSQGFQKISDDDVQKTEILYRVPLKPALIEDFRICQQVIDLQIPDNVVEIKIDGVSQRFNVGKIEGYNDAYIITKGILQEYILGKLYGAQSGEDSKRAVIATCKEIQINQIQSK